MEEMKPFVPDHFSTFLPCQYTNNYENTQHKCMLVLEITKTDVKFNLFKEDNKNKLPIEFEYKKYNVLLVSPLFCTFVSLKDERSTTFYFFQELCDNRSNNNFRRFIFTLADAGMLTYDPNDSLSEIYNNQIIFRFIPQHSFIPDGLYSFVYTIIYRNVRAICLSRIKSIMQTSEEPFNQKYIELVIPSVRFVEMQRISSTIENRKTKYESNFDFLHHLKIISKVLDKSNDDDIYQIFKAQLTTIKDQRFQIIESDCREFNEKIKNKEKNKSCFYLSQIDTKKWNDKLSTTCMNVCKIHIVSENVTYYKNGFLIAMRIALFLKNGERLENLAEFSPKGKNIKEIEAFRKKINSITQSKTEDEFEITVFFIYKAIMKALSTDTAHYMAYEFSMNAYEYFSPTTKAYFVYKKIRSFGWIEDDVKEMFQSTFKSPWIAWLFILKTNNPEKAYHSLIASVIFHLIPQLVNQKIQGEESIEQFWPNFQRNLQNDLYNVKSIINVATYIYDGSAFQNSI